MSEVEVLNPTYKVYDYQGPTEAFDYHKYDFTVSLRRVVSLLKSEEFDRLKSAWITETQFYSDPEIIYCNENYERIIKYKYSALPFIINDLRANLNDWFYALNKITNQNPVLNEHIGDVEAMANDWIEWYETNFGVL